MQYNTLMLVYEFKLKGKSHQYQAIDQAIRVVQFIRNKAVRYWMDNRGSGKNDLYKLAASLPKEFEFSDKLNSTARQQATERAWSAISKFFENCKKKIPGKKGYPKFQKDNRSVEYKQSGWKLVDGCKRIHFSDKCGIGTLKLIGKQCLNQFQDKIKRVRLVRRADGYYAQFCLDIERKEHLTSTGSIVGLDMGISYLWTDSNGNTLENPRTLKRAEKALKRVQRRLSRKQKGSSNRRKQIKRLAKKHLKVQRQRKDFAIKAARALYQSHDLVVIENLQVKNMLKNHNLAKAISDASWHQIKRWLEYFSRVFSKGFVIVSPHHTSQDCSSCGERVAKSLSERVHHCDTCSLELDRDHNAARNILSKGLGLIGTVGHTGTGHPRDVETPEERQTAA